MLGHLALLGARRPGPADGVGWRPGGPRRRGRRGAPRRLGGPLPRRWRARGRGALPAAAGRDRGGHRRRPDRRDRDADVRPRARQPDRPRVVPLPQLRLPAAGPRRHRQDVGRDGRSAGSGRTRDSSPASRRRSRPGPPRCGPGGRRRPRARSSSSRSTATSRATSCASPRRAAGSRSGSRARASQPIIGVVELVMNGRVVAAEAAPAPADRLDLGDHRSTSTPAPGSRRAPGVRSRSARPT